MTDLEIIDLYWAKDPSAIEASKGQYGGYCYAIARSILGSHEDAEECVSDTWLGAWNAIPPQRPNRLSLFLGKIARNLALNRYKKDRTQKRGGPEFCCVLEELAESIPSPHTVESAISDRALQDILNRFLRSLPQQPCTIFLLRYWYNKPLGEIAAQLSLKEPNVKASLYRSRQKLKQYLEKEGVAL